MKRTLFNTVIGLAFLGLGTSVRASSPGMIEGPMGCSWKLSVLLKGKGPDSKLRLRFESELGSCTNIPCVGRVGDLIEIPIKLLGDKERKLGASVEAWVVDGGPQSSMKTVSESVSFVGGPSFDAGIHRNLVVSFGKVECTHTPIK